MSNSLQPLASLVNSTPILGPIGIGVSTLGTVWQQVLPADSNRRGLIFYNPGTNNLRVAPVNLAAQANAGAFLIYPGEMFELFAADEIANINSAWMAWVDTGSNQPLSILNFTGTNASVAAPQPMANLNYGVPIQSPLTYGSTLGAASASVIAANPVRRGILFHNPGTVNIAVTPANLVAVIGAGGITILPGQTKEIRARGLIRVNCGWNGIAASAGSNPLTVAELL